MSLITAHRILIGVAVVFFAFYALWEFRGADGAGAVLRGVASLLIAAALLVYLRTLKGQNGPRERGPKEGP